MKTFSDFHSKSKIVLNGERVLNVQLFSAGCPDLDTVGKMAVQKSKRYIASDYF